MWLPGAEFSHDPSLAAVWRLLEEFQSDVDEQLAVRERMLEFLARHPQDAHERTCLEGPFTASCLLLSADGQRVLLTHHKKLDRWLQLGGHCDGDANLAHVALREAEEESGIEGVRLDPVPFDLDIHTIPARKDEPEHLHLDVRFIGLAPKGAREMVSEESNDLRWFMPHEVLDLDVDDSLMRLVCRAARRPRP